MNINDDPWQYGDYWRLESSEYEQEKYSRQIALLPKTGLNCVLELGCGAGQFSRMLINHGIAQQVLGIELSQAAVARGRSLNFSANDRIELRQANVMAYDSELEGPWDLIVLSETLYYLMWEYPLKHLVDKIDEWFRSTRPGKYFLLCNTHSGIADRISPPSFLAAYRDLLIGAGYRLKDEEPFTGIKDGVNYQGLISLFVK